MDVIPSKQRALPEDQFGIKTVPVGTVAQEGRSWPIRAAIVEVQPDLAGKFLERIGDVRRRPKPVHLASLTRDMERGKFVFTGEPIIVSAEGDTLDGQHRCKVCKETGKPFTCMIVFGVPRSSYKGMNVSAKRTGADTLLIGGHQYPVIQAATAKWLYRWQSGNFFSQIVLSPTETDEIVGGHPSLADSVEKTFGARTIGISHGLLAFLHYIFREINPDAADAFFARLMTDLNHTNQKSPITVLRRKFTAVANGGRLVGQTLSDRQVVGSFFKAWNLYVEGKDCSKILFAIDEELPRLKGPD